MNLLVISLLAVASISLLPTEILGKKDHRDGLQKLEIKKGGKSSHIHDNEREVLIRNVRGAKANGPGNGSDNNGGSASSCRYTKSPWTECDVKTNTRSRTLTLKNTEEGCVATRTIQKKCKKSCRYEKGSWSECTNGQMTRSDNLKPSTDATTSTSTCQPTRVVNKNCNPAKSKDKGNKERKNRDKALRKGRA